MGYLSFFQQNFLYNVDSAMAGVELRPCFSKILARTTFVLESLSEAKNPGQDAFWEILSLEAVN